MDGTGNFSASQDTGDPLCCAAPLRQSDPGVPSTSYYEVEQLWKIFYFINPPTVYISSLRIIHGHSDFRHNTAYMHVYFRPRTVADNISCSAGMRTFRRLHADPISTIQTPEAKIPQNASYQAAKANRSEAQVAAETAASGHV